MARKIVELVPSIESVRMVNSGTEATMSAIRLARGYTGRNKIIKFNGCYHGHSDCLLVKAGSGALTHGNPDSAGVPASFTEHTLIAEFNNPEQIEKLFERYGEDIACIIIEPYPGNCGLLIPHDGYLKFLRDICDRYKSVLIFDEVMTGFRVALGGAQEREGVIPDLTTLGKVIGGGLPVGAFGGKKEIMEYIAPLGPVYQAGTLSGNPLAMAAGLTALKVLEETRPYELLDTMAKSIKENLEAVAKEEGIALSIPQVGSMLSLFFCEEIPRSFPEVMNSNRDYFIKIFRYALDNGVFLPPSPFEACFLSTAHQGEPLNIIIEVLSDAIRALKN